MEGQGVTAGTGGTTGACLSCELKTCGLPQVCAACLKCMCMLPAGLIMKW